MGVYWRGVGIGNSGGSDDVGIDSGGGDSDSEGDAADVLKGQLTEYFKVRPPFYSPPGYRGGKSK